MATKYKDLPPEERPDVRLKERSSASLTNAELLSLSVRLTSPEEAHALLAKLPHGLRTLADASMHELRELGLTEKQSIKLLADAELGKRIYTGTRTLRAIRGPEDAEALVRADLRHAKQEKVEVILLDNKSNLISVEEISKGNVSQSIADSRDVFRIALKHGASGLILVHNHPSGDSRPSGEDLALTHNMAQAGNLLNVKVFDHIIIGDGEYFSIKREHPELLNPEAHGIEAPIEAKSRGGEPTIVREAESDELTDKLRDRYGNDSVADPIDGMDSDLPTREATDDISERYEEEWELEM